MTSTAMERNSKGATKSKKDFFISYTQADRGWAEWIAWTLEADGWTTIIQAWDFRPASNFVVHMDAALKSAERMVAVLSNEYCKSAFARSEWAAAFAHDPMGESGTLLPVRVGNFDQTGLLAQVVYIDLIGRDKSTAAEALLAGALRGRAKPTTQPPFPGGAQSEPSYPGEQQFETQARSESRTLLPRNTTNEDGLSKHVPPPRPDLVIGRENNIIEIVALLLGNRGPIVLTGWPGVGKTTVAQLLLDSPELKREFPEGQYWVEFRPHGSALESLETLATVLQIKIENDSTSDMRGLVTSLRSRLNSRRVLLIIDDVWTIEQGEALRSILGDSVGVLVTSRFPSVARRLVLRPGLGIYPLEELSSEDGFLLIATLAPEIAKSVPDELRELCKQLEGLPLALQIAGRLLAEEHRLGLSVLPLLKELGAAHRLLDERAPEDRFDPEFGTTPTVRLLFERSTDHLDKESRERFALLGEWINPAVFDTQILSELWETANPLPTLRRFADLGLLAPIGGGWFRMHALLIAHASRLLD